MIESKTPRGNSFTDITNQTFGRLTALYPTDQRSKQGNVVWHCRCSCGKEINVAYNDLVYSNWRSCGCKKKEHEANLRSYLTHVAGTSLDILKSQKTPANNTSGTKGVYFVRGKWLAKIVFQKKAYYLGSYDQQDEAVQARKVAEDIINHGTLEHYERWKERAEADPEWAAENPIEIKVHKSDVKGLEIEFLPVL